MLSEKMEAALNDQLVAETYSAYLYVSMSAYFGDQNLPGFSHWMFVQAQEELLHVQRFFNYIIERHGTVKLAAIAAPPASWESPAAAFQKSYDHELEVSARIHALVEQAQAERDHSTYNFLQWFVAEQVEEEKNVDGVLQDLKRMGKSDQGLFMLDREAGLRVLTVPGATAAT